MFMLFWAMSRSRKWGWMADSTSLALELLKSQYSPLASCSWLFQNNLRVDNLYQEDLLVPILVITYKKGLVWKSKKFNTYKAMASARKYSVVYYPYMGLMGRTYLVSKLDI